jgi:hypothetical protein
MEPTPALNRIGLAAIACMIAALALSGLLIVLPAAANGDLAAVRDDDGKAVVAQEDDDDDDDDDTETPTRTRSGSRSIGSNSGNTRTGTTRGTGPSRTVSDTSDRSKNTRTGTTRGTGPSRSVSNSS